MNRVAVLLAIVTVPSVYVYGQHYDTTWPAGGPFSRAAVVNAPFTADATTKIRIRLPDGSAGEYTVIAHYYRNSQGRVRAEMDTPWGPYVILWVPGGKGRQHYYGLDPVQRTYWTIEEFVAPQLFNGESRVAVPVAKGCFRTAPPVISDVIDQHRLDAVSAQMAPDLRIATESHRSDEIASVAYEVANIRHEEPPADLFELPPITHQNRGLTPTH